MNLLEHHSTAELVQMLSSAKPNVAPVLIAGRAKGRLDHALRHAGFPTQFSRKVATRAIGQNMNTNVAAYIRKSSLKSAFY